MDKEELKKKVGQKFIEFLKDPIIKEAILQNSRPPNEQITQLQKEIQILNEELSKADEEIERLKIKIDGGMTMGFSKSGIPKTEIFEQMRKILMKSLSNVLIIVPSTRDLENLLLYELKSSINITIDCFVDPKDNEQLELLEELESLDNITIKNYDRKDRYALLRDGEELLIGIPDKSQENNLLIYTDDQKHIKVLSSLVFEVKKSRKEF